MSTPSFDPEFIQACFQLLSSDMYNGSPHDEIMPVLYDLYTNMKENSPLKDFYNDYENPESLPYKLIFSELNLFFRDLELEIRSIKIDGILYHALVSSDEDDPIIYNYEMKRFSQTQIEFLSFAIKILIDKENKGEGFDNLVRDFCHSEIGKKLVINKSGADKKNLSNEFLNHLLLEKYFLKNQRNNIILGPRIILQLRKFIGNYSDEYLQQLEYIHY